jgi:hypothetical protein
MDKDVRIRFWIEAVVGGLAVALAVLTLITDDWVEALTGFDPDQHDGSFEWTLVIALLAVAVIAGGLARANWGRMQTAR